MVGRSVARLRPSSQRTEARHCLHRWRKFPGLCSPSPISCVLNRCQNSLLTWKWWVQVTCQDISTMMRQEQNSIIFLINNGGYTIEVEIHDGPYNVIKNWSYTGFVDAIHNGEGKVWTTKVECLNFRTIRNLSSLWMNLKGSFWVMQVSTEAELIPAIATATGDKKDCLCFIEVICHKDDTSKELLEWGSRVSAANGRPPTAFT